MHKTDVAQYSSSQVNGPLFSNHGTYTLYLLQRKGQLALVNGLNLGSYFQSIPIGIYKIDRMVIMVILEFKGNFQSGKMFPDPLKIGRIYLERIMPRSDHRPFR